MHYSKITLVVAIEPFDDFNFEPLDYVLPELELASEVHVLESTSEPMILQPDHRLDCKKADS